ncbi:MAG: hypothetical protein U0Y96_05675 [Candidatus Kapaibacterium sp.]
MKSKIGKLHAFSVVLGVFILSTFSINAQQGARIYLRYDDNNLYNSNGVRIKQEENKQWYWVLGNQMEYQAYSTTLAKIGWGCVNLGHKHYKASQSTRTVGFPSDFATTGSDITVAEYRSKNTLPYVFTNHAMALTKVDQFFNLNGGANTTDDYELTTRAMTPGARIIRNAGNYITAYNLYDMTQDTGVGGGGNFFDWGVASINATTNAVNWNFAALTGNPAMRYHEEVRDIVQIGNDYYVCGVKRNFATGQMGGFVAMITAGGALQWYKNYYPAPGQTYTFECISAVPNPAGDRILVSGLYIPDNTVNVKGVITMEINAGVGGGGVTWRYSWIPQAPYTVVDLGTKTQLRHVKTNDDGVVVCATVQDRSGFGVTYGSLFKIWNKSLQPSRSCGGLGAQLFAWGGRYETWTLGRLGTELVNTNLVDVTNRLEPSHLDEDIAAVGTAQVYHFNTLIKDVMVLETDYDGVYGRSNSSGPGGIPNTGYCKDAFLLYECAEPYYEIEDVNPSMTDNLLYTNTKLSPYDDTFDRNCESVLGGDDGLGDIGNAKRPSDSSPVSGEVKYNAINVAPIPATENITISIEISELTEATLSLIDQQGNEIKNFGTFVFKPGIYTQTFNSSSLSSGLYAFRLNGLTFSKIVALPVIH